MFRFSVGILDESITQNGKLLGELLHHAALSEGAGPGVGEAVVRDVVQPRADTEEHRGNSTVTIEGDEFCPGGSGWIVLTYTAVFKAPGFIFDRRFERVEEERCGRRGTGYLPDAHGICPRVVWGDEGGNIHVLVVVGSQ